VVSTQLVSIVVPNAGGMSVTGGYSHSQYCLELKFLPSQPLNRCHDSWEDCPATTSSSDPSAANSILLPHFQRQVPVHGARVVVVVVVVVGASVVVVVVVFMVIVVSAALLSHLPGAS